MLGRFTLVLVVLLAGCTAGPPSEHSTAERTPPAVTEPASAPPSTQSGTLATQPAGTRTTVQADAATTPPPTATQTGEPTRTPPRNPWRAETVVVNVSNEAGGAPAMRETFERALAYWKDHRDAADYRVRFAFRPDADRADITIRYVEGIDHCGADRVEGPLLGCAPYLDGVDRVTEPIDVRIAASDDPQTVYNTLRHEIGHVLGIGHGEPPMPLMAENNLYTKAAPWNRSALRVHVDYSDKPGIATESFEEQIVPTLRFFEDGAETTIDPPPRYRRGASRANANIVIVLHDEVNPETGRPGSTAETVTGDVNGTVYKQVVIALWDVDTGAVGWHLGYWLVYSFERTVTAADIPPPFVDAGYHERRSVWWR